MLSRIWAIYQITDARMRPIHIHACNPNTVLSSIWAMYQITDARIGPAFGSALEQYMLAEADSRLQVDLT